MKLLGIDWRRGARLTALTAAAMGTTFFGCNSTSNGTSGTTASAATVGAGPATSGTPGGSSTGAKASSSGTGGSGTGTASGGSSSGGTSTGGSPAGPVVIANAGFTTAFDATDDGAGNVYFTGLSASGSTVFKTTDNGANLAATDLGVTGLTAGFGIALSKDGQTLYVADPAAESDTFSSGAITGTTLGQIIAVANSGGNAIAVSGTQGYAPVALATTNSGGSDTLTFTGLDPANGQGGVFTIAAAGGTAAVLAEGPPFISPSGVLVASTGTTYVLDRGQVIAVRGSPGVATVLASGLYLGFPGGIGISEDGSTLYVSVVDPAVGSDAVAEIAAATGDVTYALNGPTTSGGFGPLLVEPAGLQGGTVAGAPYVFVDGLAGGTGAVYTLPLH